MTAGQSKRQRCANAQRKGPHAEEIKAAIRMRGTTMADLARSWGYSDSAIRHALREPYPKFEKLIADYLGVKPDHLWPDRYDSKGNTLYPKGRRRKS